MAYRLKRGESVTAGVKRIAREELGAGRRGGAHKDDFACGCRVRAPQWLGCGRVSHPVAARRENDGTRSQ